MKRERTAGCRRSVPVFRGWHAGIPSRYARCRSRLRGAETGNLRCGTKKNGPMVRIRKKCVSLRSRLSRGKCGKIWT